MVDKDGTVAAFEALPTVEGRTNYLHVARALRDRLEAFIAGTGRDDARMRTILDVAVTELAIAATDYEASTGTKRMKRVTAHEQSTACRHFCSEHEELISPTLWGNLPRELLPLIFARLSLPGIGRLRSVSREWQKSIDSVDSEFSQELQAMNHSMVALISPLEDSLGDFQVRVYDVKRNTWHCYDMHATIGVSSTLGAADGGLVCFVSEGLDGPLSIVVINPFTLTWRTLPCLQHLSEVQPTMVHLSVDPQTGKYKVVVAGFMVDGDRGLVVEVYDSGNDQWTKADSLSSERICGYAYDWEINLADSWFEEILLGPCVYDFAAGRLENVWQNNMETVWQRPTVESYVLLNNRLFVLHKEARRPEPGSLERVIHAVYCIAEFQHNGSTWVKVGSHSCEPFERCPKQEYKLTLHAACGFLMVFADIGTEPPYYHESGWLYQLSTRKWCDLPTLPKEYNVHEDSCDLLSEIKWSAVP